jgi:hypothetical protein
VSAEIAIGLERYQAKVKMISEGGLRLEAHRQLPASPLVVAFELPGHGPVRLLSEICSSADAPRSYSCRFKEAPPEIREKIAAYIRRVKQAFTAIQLSLALGKPRFHVAGLLKEVQLEKITNPAELRLTVAKAIEQLQSSSP